MTFFSLPAAGAERVVGVSLLTGAMQACLAQQRSGIRDKLRSFPSNRNLALRCGLRFCNLRGARQQVELTMPGL